MTQEKLASAAAPAVAEPPRVWTRRHLLDVDDFTPAELEAVMQTTDAMKEVMGRDVPRVPALRGKTIVTLFYEASTRTRASFELAGKALGADVINISAGGSSVEKGESLIDTVRTLQAVGAEVVVCAPPTLLPIAIRTPAAGRGSSPNGDSREGLALPPVRVETDLDRALEGAEVVMTLRLQKERMLGGLLPSLREYATLYQLN